MTSRSRIVLAVQRLILRSGRTPLGRLWALAYRWLARAVTAYVTWGERDAAAYTRGGLASGDLQPGLSDVDTAVILAQDPTGPGPADGRARRRWQRLSHTFPHAEALVERPMICEHAALRDISGGSTLTYGLDRPEEPALRPTVYFGKGATLDRLVILERPGLYRAEATDWRLIAGPDRRPADPPRDAQLRRIAAWSELRFWWRWAFPVCIDPTGPRAAALCVKLIAEPTRVWLWLAHAERVSSRVEALQRGLRWMPEENDALRGALELHRALPDSPDPPLTAVLPALVRISTRIAALIGAEIAAEDETAVRLAGAPAEPRARPLVDWRGLVCPTAADEAFEPHDADPGDPAVLATAALRDGPCPALRSGELMVLPAQTLLGTRLRAVQCAATDPVSVALAEGHGSARFPAVRGWSARDTAARAIAEHAAWLRGGPASSAPPGSPRPEDGGLGMLFTAARAAILLESIAEGDPVLPLTVTETARRLAERSSTAGAIAEEALGCYREVEPRRTRPAVATVSAMRKLVMGLPAYAAADGMAADASTRRAPVRPASAP